MKRIAFDLTLIAFLHFAGIYMDLYWEPVSRDIDCYYKDDYFHEKQENTVTPAAVLTGSGFIPMAIMIFTDAIFCRNGKKDIYDNIVTFEIGGLLVFVSNNLLKYYLGYHRPYFLTVCKPMNVMCVRGPLPNPTCQGDPKEIKWARLSFPSLHSSITAYGVLFLMVFLYRRRMKVNQKYFYSVFMAAIYVSALTWTLFVSLTRVLDRRHHVIDVIGGLSWGAIISVITILTMIPRGHSTSNIELSPCLTSNDDEKID